MKNLGYFFILIFSVLFSQITYSQDDPKKTEVSVLPIICPDFSKSLLQVLADDFRSALTATGKFNVMSRELMEEIMQEQAFQMTGACDESGCLVKAGRIIGVSEIISATITVLPNNTYAVSAKRVSVGSGKLIASGTEKRQGGSYEINKRMLVNLASVLAGKPNEDHFRYKREQNLKLQEIQRTEEVTAKRWKMSLEGFGFYPFKLLETNPDQKVRSYVEQHKDITEYNIPPGEELGTGLNVGMFRRMGKKSWFGAKANYSIKGGYERYYFAWEQPQDSSNAGYLYIGDYSGNSKYAHTEKLISVGLGFIFNLYQGSIFNVSLSTFSQIGWAMVDGNSFRREFYDLNWYRPDSSFAYREVNTMEKAINFDGSGIAFGGNMNISSEYFVTPGLSISVGVDFDYMLSPYISGKQNVNKYQTIDYSTSTNSVVTDTSYTNDFGSMSGNWLENGEFVEYRNPNDKYYGDSGDLVSSKKHYVEFADFCFKMGIGFYF